MSGRLKLTVACGDYEIVRALKEGAVQADGIELVMLTDMGSKERHWRMARKAEFDVCEVNVGGYFMSRDRGEALAAPYPASSTAAPASAPAVRFARCSISRRSKPTCWRRVGRKQMSPLIGWNAATSCASARANACPRTA